MKSLIEQGKLLSLSFSVVIALWQQAAVLIWILSVEFVQ